MYKLISLQASSFPGKCTFSSEETCLHKKSNNYFKQACCLDIAINLYFSEACRYISEATYNNDTDDACNTV